MRLRTRANRLWWQTRRGAFSFYFDGAARAVLGAARVLEPARRSRPRGRAGWTGLFLVAATPLTLFVAEQARSVRQAALLTSPGASRGEVASLRGPLDRYYERKESGQSLDDAREVAIHVDVSGYTSRICETDSTPFITAANTLTRPGVLALSRDLLKRYTPGAPFDFGDIVHLTGIGDFMVEDAMADRWERRADIWFTSLEQARSFGRRKVVMTGPYGVADYDVNRERRTAQVASTRVGAAP